MTNKSDNIIEIYCPACGKKMKKIYMPEQGINLDVCTEGCGGIYFDNRELKAFDKPQEDISPLEDLYKDKKFKSVDENETRYCPVCGNIMVKNYASQKKEIQIDECYNCGGKFLDYGELQKIRSQNPQKNSSLNQEKNIQTNEYNDLYSKLNLYDYREPFTRLSDKNRIIIMVILFLFLILFFTLITYLCNKYNAPYPFFHHYFWWSHLSI